MTSDVRLTESLPGRLLLERSLALSSHLDVPGDRGDGGVELGRGEGYGNSDGYGQSGVIVAGAQRLGDVWCPLLLFLRSVGVPAIPSRRFCSA